MRVIIIHRLFLRGNMIDINVYEKKWYSSLEAVITFIKQVIANVPDIHNKKISILLTNDQHIQELNKAYRNKDKPTNVLSFPYENFLDGTIGDITLALETITTEAKEANIPLEEHLAHMIIHGVLHLLGYDHEQDEEAIIMEKLEDEIMLQLKEKQIF